MLMKTNDQILKARDDKAPLLFSTVESEAGGEIQFKLADGNECSWLKPGETFGPVKLRPRIEPWLTALFQSEHLALLIGSGLSFSVHRIATGNGLPGMKPATFADFGAAINGEAAKSATAAGRSKGIVSHDDPLGRIMRIYGKLGRQAQITLLIGNHLADFQTLVDNYLPKPAIDRTTFRMAELLKSRWGSHQTEPATAQSKTNEIGEEL
jgi:hypothetical protein